MTHYGPWRESSRNILRAVRHRVAPVRRGAAADFKIALALLPEPAFLPSEPLKAPQLVQLTRKNLTNRINHLQPTPLNPVTMHATLKSEEEKCLF